MNTLKAFTRQCLLFRSTDKINWLFGALMWIDIAAAIYSLSQFLNAGS